MWASFNEIGWVEIAAQLTVEFLLQNIMLVYFWELLQQHLKGYRMFLEKSWVSENFRRVSKSRRSKLESRNLELAKYNARLGISNFEIDSPSLANQAKVLISLNRHKITATTTAKQRATERYTSVVIVSRWDF